MTSDEIQVFVDIDSDIMVIEKTNGDVYAYRLSNEIELYGRLIGGGATEHIWIDKEGEQYQEMVKRDEEIQKILADMDKLEYEVYSQERVEKAR